MESMKLIEKGKDLLKSGRWREARVAFEQALTLEKSPEALEGLGTSCSWLNDGDGSVRAREEAFRLYAKAGDDRSAARVATWLANEYGEFRGEGAVAGGWLTRAQRLVQDLEPCSEQVAVLAMSASVKLFLEKDPAAARALAVSARLIAEKVKNPDGIMGATALEGLALVSEGEVRQGMRLLDEATAIAVGGECEDLNIIGRACCCLIAACERVRDYDRAAQWCHHVKEFSRKWRIGSLFSVCRTQYSAVLISRGEWMEAEEELVSAVEELSERRPALTGSATVRLAELRRLQGRFDEARTLFCGMETHPIAQLGLGAIALDEDDPATAAEFAQRFLRRMPEGDKVERVPGLELLVRAHARNRDLGKAREILAELQSTIAAISAEPLAAAGRFAEGIVATAGDDTLAAVACLEDAVDLFEKACMPYESLMARIELAGVFHRLGRSSRAEREADIARTQAETLGAGFLMQLVERLSGSSRRRPPTFLPNREEKGLTTREKEILFLIADGKENSQIADDLFLSVRTVERHISNLYQKLGVSGKSARSAATAYAVRNLQAK